MKHFKRLPARLSPAAVLLACSGILMLGAAQADDSPRASRAMLPQYKQECAACHLAYPAGMLPARSWSRIMSGLDKHYGSDASLDAATVRQISDWLQSNAGTYKRVRDEPPQDRITRSSWFVRKHRELDDSVWTHTSVKSAANCAACHTRAEQGSFDDDELKFPADLDARHRKAFEDR